MTRQMNFLLGILFAFAPVALALKAPAVIHSFNGMGIRKMPANVSGIPVVDDVIKNTPKFVEAAISFKQTLNGSHRIFDALTKSTSTPRGISSFLELDRKVDGAMEKSRASAEIKDIIRFGSKRLHQWQGFGIDSINIGLARSAAPWYSFMKSLADEESNFEYFDANDVQLVGGAAFFLNILFKSEGDLRAGNWRLCMAAGLGAQVFFKGKYYPTNSMIGSDFGGEDLYFGFAKSANVPGWSWNMDFNHDYVTRYVGLVDPDKNKLQGLYSQQNHQFSHLSRLSGGFEFTSMGPLRDLVAINFAYCLMGRSQGGDCVDRLATDTQSEHMEDTEQVLTSSGEDTAMMSLSEALQPDKWKTFKNSNQAQIILNLVFAHLLKHAGLKPSLGIDDDLQASIENTRKISETTRLEILKDALDVELVRSVFQELREIEAAADEDQVSQLTELLKEEDILKQLLNMFLHHDWLDQENWERIGRQEKWSKNTVYTGVGHCWCSTDAATGTQYWKDTLELDFNDLIR